ncbi:MAG: RNA polymerase sigma factor, partial [Casimicrobiaceae bacterium]
ALQGYAPERIRALAPRPWLYQITLNVFRNRLRRHHLPEASLFLDDSNDHTFADEPRADERDGPEFVVLDGERRSELTALLARLPERHRVAVILRHVEGLSYGELAVILDQPVGTIKANVHRGVAALRNALTQSQDAVSNESTAQIAVSNVSENPANVAGVGRRTRSPEEVT